MNMFSFKILVFLSLFVALKCATSRANSPSMGYLFVNGSRPPHCYDLIENDICPPDYVDYKILGFDSSEEVAKVELQSVKFSLQLLDFFPSASQACRDSIREYSCSNNFAHCTPDSKHGVDLKYDWRKTALACDKIRSNCPEIVQEAITYNCSLIQKDASGYTYCVNLPDVPGDVCSKSKYKYPEALGYFYKATAKAFPKNLAQFVKDKLFTNISCEQEFVDVTCQLMRGSICSTDMTLRLYAISQQDCASTMTKCIASKIPAVVNYFLEMCKILPDANTAKRVPLPSVAVRNSIKN